MNWTVDLLSPLRDQPDRLVAIILEQARLLESLLRQQSQWEQEKAQAVAALQSVREELRQKNQEILRLSEHLQEKAGANTASKPSARPIPSKSPARSVWRACIWDRVPWR